MVLGSANEKGQEHEDGGQMLATTLASPTKQNSKSVRASMKKAFAFVLVDGVRAQISVRQDMSPFCVFTTTGYVINS